MKALLATWRGRFIAAFLLVQLLLPLAYYVGRRDPHDERFAWRMFSPMRMVRCTLDVTRDGAPVPLGSEFHEAWIELAQRGRFAVIDAMGETLCDRYPNTRIEPRLACTYLDGSKRDFGGYDICTVGGL